MKNLITKLIISLSFCSASHSLVLGQVTIGSEKSPVEGALLQLKENDDPLANSARGLGLPRVNITSQSNLFPMFAGDADYENNIDNKKNLENTAHMGLVVYNLNTDFCEEIYPGVHVWDGEKWNLVGEDVFPGETDILVDERDPNKIERYKIGKFGDSWWMIENLRAEIWPEGNSTDMNISLHLPVHMDDPNKTDAMFYYPKYDKNLFLKNPHYGYMYNFHAATRSRVDPYQAGSETTAGQGICPNGWHLPTSAEWQELRGEVEQNPCRYAHSKISENTGYNMQSKTETPNGVSRTVAQGGFDSPLLGLIAYQNNLDPDTGLPIGLDTWWIGERALYWVSDMHHYFALVHDLYRATFYTSNFGFAPVRCKKD